MLVNVSDLKPNPFRRIAKYPIDPAKIKALKNSIKETDFWDNILARKKNGKYEIAYGHHRLKALKELKIEKVNIPVKDIDDSTMIKIMANENMAEWSSNTGVILETIQVAKEYLDKEIGKYEDLNHAQEILRVLFDSNSQYLQCKQSGIGQGIIKKFLGGNWTDYYIESALSILKNGNIDSDAVKHFDKIGEAQVVSQVLKDHNIPKAKQDKIVKRAFEKYNSDVFKSIKISNGYNGILNRQRKETKIKAVVEDAIEDEGYKIQKENFNKIFPKHDERPDIKDVAQSIITSITEINCSLPDVMKQWDYLGSSLQHRLINSISKIFKILEENKGGTKWKQLSR